MQVLEFLVKVFHLLMGKEKGRSADNVVNGINLIHDDKIRILLIILDCFGEVLKQRVRHLIMSPLLQLEVLDTTAYLEEILDDVLLLAAVLTRIRLNHQLIAMRSQHLTKCLSCIIHSLIIQEVKLLQDVDYINLILRS